MPDMQPALLVIFPISPAETTKYGCAAVVQDFKEFGGLGIYWKCCFCSVMTHSSLQGDPVGAATEEMVGDTCRF
jgi:hypothetical protein